MLTKFAQAQNFGVELFNNLMPASGGMAGVSIASPQDVQSAINGMRDTVGNTAGGILPPGGAAHVQYLEALNAAIPQHRITGGMGVRNVLPGVDFDLLAGGMFEASQTFGITTATVKSYWVGAGITWRFGCGACE